VLAPSGVQIEIHQQIERIRTALVQRAVARAHAPSNVCGTSSDPSVSSVDGVCIWHGRMRYQLDKVQRGQQPDDFKPMPAIGKGVEEIRIWDDSGTYRVIYTARMPDAVYVLHAFQKKAQATSKRDIEIAKQRLTKVLKGQT